MQIEEFLAQVLTVVPLSHDAVKTMGELYKLDEVRNAEIRVKLITYYFLPSTFIFLIILVFLRWIVKGGCVLD